MMAFCNLPYNTQLNEALNQAIANAAPKMFATPVPLVSMPALHW